MDFNTLLQQAQRLTNETQDSEELPRVERTISQVLEATEELHSRVTQTGAQDIQAHILLGSKGIDLPKLTQKLESLNTQKTFEPLDPIADTDIQSFLKNEKENAILSIIEEVHKSSNEAAQRRRWENIKAEWRQEKINILNSLVGPSQNWVDLQKVPEQSILLENSSMRSNLNRTEMAYAREVFEYNSIIIKGGCRPNLVQIFAKVAGSFEDQKVNEIWEIMKYMVNVSAISRTRDPIQSRLQIHQFVDQAKKYLENRYKLYMTTIISGNLREAQRGGVPSTFNLVSSFVGLTFNQGNWIGLQDATIEGKPLWPMVYYCLRCGDLPSALRCMQLGGAGHEDFVQVLEDKINKPEQKINSKLEGQLKLHYCNKIKNSTDPYKKAVYCIIAGCDVNEQHSEVAKTTDDFLWIQLSILRSDVSADNTEVLTYSGLQTTILEKYGETYFNANEQRHLYFQVLALTGQFEAAIEFLARTEQYRTHAVHIALALNEMCLIAGPRNVQEPLLSVDIEDPIPMRRLNMARLVMLYAKKFEITDPAEALQYFFFLRNLKDPEGCNLFLVCVRDLAIECRSYDMLFGTMQPNGIVSGGLFEKFECVDFDTRKAASMVAQELVRKGMFEDAIALFDIGGLQGQVIRYICVMLSQVVQEVSKKGSLRERLAIKAAEFSNRIRGSHVDCDGQMLHTFNLLNDLVTFFDYYHEQNYQIALEILSKTKLVPMSMNDLDECINNFRRLSGEICKVFPDILLATMDILFTQYKTIKNKESNMLDSTRDNQLHHLRQSAKAITNMAATVPYRMPGDTNKRLIQTEIMMH
ncbi:nuclear pore complex protein Nup93-1-like [Teleopsis dalmanni]|uniref:nuclear pore complex protein Nup93-1-like n=1 Tax=Teleopsis dalmanni TaxID=139649 RepID=UPI0018CD02D9|nr:nuclear pore complex protein Nup93-1-like [Teleopsis dalmanni]XP_037938861.1 nuclear pore complex protein Nup93-1-like [Teleopsis dalmanni]